MEMLHIKLKTLKLRAMTKEDINLTFVYLFDHCKWKISRADIRLELTDWGYEYFQDPKFIDMYKEDIFSLRWEIDS